MGYEIAAVDVAWRSANGRAFAEACVHDRHIMRLHVECPALHAVLSVLISVEQRRVAIWAEDAHDDGGV